MTKAGLRVWALWGLIEKVKSLQVPVGVWHHLAGIYQIWLTLLNLHILKMAESPWSDQRYSCAQIWQDLTGCSPSPSLVVHLSSEVSSLAWEMARRWEGGKAHGKHRDSMRGLVRESLPSPPSLRKPGPTSWNLTWKFSAMRAGITDLGITTTFLLIWNRIRTRAEGDVVFPLIYKDCSLCIFRKIKHLCHSLYL